MEALQDLLWPNWNGSCTVRMVNICLKGIDFQATFSTCHVIGVHLKHLPCSSLHMKLMEMRLVPGQGAFTLRKSTLVARQRLWSIHFEDGVICDTSATISSARTCITLGALNSYESKVMAHSNSTCDLKAEPQGQSAHLRVKKKEDLCARAGFII